MNDSDRKYFDDKFEPIYTALNEIRRDRSECEVRNTNRITKLETEYARMSNGQPIKGSFDWLKALKFFIVLAVSIGTAIGAAVAAAWAAGMKP